MTAPTETPITPLSIAVDRAASWRRWIKGQTTLTAMECHRKAAEYAMQFCEDIEAIASRSPSPVGDATRDKLIAALESASAPDRLREAVVAFLQSWDSMTPNITRDAPLIAALRAALKEGEAR